MADKPQDGTMALSNLSVIMARVADGEGERGEGLTSSHLGSVVMDKALGKSDNVCR